VEVICTRAHNPNQDDQSWPHRNQVADHLLQNNPTMYPEQNLQTCSVCGMPLIIENRYVPIDKLGEGGFGVTYLALDLSFRDEQGNPKKRALKRFKHENFLRSDILQRAKDMAIREASTLDDISHSRIPRVFAPCIFEAPRDQRLPLSQPNELEFYLPEQYIAGKDLDKLQNERLQQEKPEFFSTSEIRNILDDILDILKTIHSKNIIHRDIKPSNIIFSASDNRFHLIDFGVVKVIDQIQSQRHETLFADDGFKPPEQLRDDGFQAPEQLQPNKFSEPCTDLYSLAITCISLLTGCRNPNRELQERPYISRWQEVARVDAKLAAALSRMMQPRKEDRYQSADEIIKSLPKKPRGVFWTIGVVGLLAVVAIAFHIPSIICKLQGNCKLVQPIPSEDLPEYFTAGEESLVDDHMNFASNIESTPKCNEAYDLKIAGMKAFKEDRYVDAEKNFSNAIIGFQNTRQKNVNLVIDETHQPSAPSGDYCPYDAETQIFLENTKARLGNKSPITVAVSIPAGDPDQKGVAFEMLIGAAQAQAKFNASGGADDRLLELIIVKDGNKEEFAKQTAESLKINQIPTVKDGQMTTEKVTVLGVVGYLTSSVALSASEVLDNKLIISSTSTAVRSNDENEDEFNLPENVFRTPSTDNIGGADLASYAMEKSFSKILVVYNSGEPYGRSLTKSFKSEIGDMNIADCDLNNVAPASCPDLGEGGAADAILIIVNTNELGKAETIINRKSSAQQVFGGDALYSGNFFARFQSNADAINGMVLAVPWHWNLPNKEGYQGDPDFILGDSGAKITWGTETVSWRVATTYDAMFAITESLKNIKGDLNSDTLLSEFMSFKGTESGIVGATGNINFDANGDRKPFTGLGVLVEVGNESVPTLLDTPER
jgi:serine/threonine-protein kinase